FKPTTNDMREATSIDVIHSLLEKGAKIKAYDPKAYNCAKLIFGNKINYCSSSYEAIENVDALLLLTEWNEFKSPDFNKMKSLMKHHVIFDGRNQYDLEKIKECNFEYYHV
ncbi:MAG: UDP-glucose 6-dehydrogenase, partial [Acetobacter sp.]|nr:UDP-glucose 6-dehydrogenase [Acetobacter sp.]